MPSSTDNIVQHCVWTNTRLVFKDILSCTVILSRETKNCIFNVNHQWLTWPWIWKYRESSTCFDRYKKILSYRQVLYYLEVQMPQPVSLTLPWPSLSHCRGTFLKLQPLACSKSVRKTYTLWSAKKFLPCKTCSWALPIYQFSASYFLSVLNKWPESTTMVYPFVKYHTRAFHVCQRQSSMDQGEVKEQL